MSRVEHIKNMWRGNCKILGPQIAKNGKEYLIAAIEREKTLDLYLYDAVLEERHVCSLFSRWTTDDSLIIDDIQIAGVNCNRGLASILMDQLLLYASIHNAKSLSGTLSSVDKDHFDRSEAFYKKHGFTVEFNQDRTAGHVYKKMQEKSNLTREQQLMITGMDMLLRKFNRMPDSESFTVEEIIAASNMVYDEIISNDGEDEQVNMFKKPMTEQEQLELSDLLDKFLQMYENGFADQLIGDTDDDADNLKYEFGQLYNVVKMLSDRALD